MIPDLVSLRCFVAAATHPSFRSAARAVALSPPAFSDRISQLEQSLSASLFTRTTRNVQLTDQGRRLLPQAVRCLEAAVRCQAAVHATERLPFELTIGTRFELGISWVLPALVALEKQRPDRRLHLYFGDTSDVLPRVARQEVDCMITSARIAQGGLIFVPLVEEHYVFVGARSLISERPLKKPSDAHAHTLLDMHADLPLFRYFRDARPAQEVWSFDRVQHLGAIAAVRTLVLAGAGVAVLPTYYVKDELKSKELVELGARTTLPSDWFRLVWRRGHPRSAELRELGAEFARRPLT
ncbi:MAG: hypothetical protein RJA70_257 [Pseudomonadota bacterium]|jgi:DNA-binding transcriptional LysR family regulator